jgi:hypothetical protein
MVDASALRAFLNPRITTLSPSLDHLYQVLLDVRGSVIGDGANNTRKESEKGDVDDDDDDGGYAFGGWEEEPDYHDGGAAVFSSAIDDGEIASGEDGVSTTAGHVAFPAASRTALDQQVETMVLKSSASNDVSMIILYPSLSLYE